MRDSFVIVHFLMVDIVSNFQLLWLPLCLLMIHVVFPFDAFPSSACHKAGNILLHVGSVIFKIKPSFSRTFLKFSNFQSKPEHVFIISWDVRAPLTCSGNLDVSCTFSSTKKTIYTEFFLNCTSFIPFDVSDQMYLSFVWSHMVSKSLSNPKQ